MKIYLAIARYDYEGLEVIKAFKNKRKVYTFIDKCNQYSAAKLTIPEVDAADKEWEEHCKKEDKWRSKHPAGSNLAGCDNYSVIETELYE